MTTYTTEAIACGLSDVAGWLENEGGRDKHARTIRLGVERLRELAPEAHRRPLVVDIGVVGPVNGMNEPDKSGSYMRLVLTTFGGRREERLISLGAAEVFNAELHNALPLPAAPSHPGEADRAGLGELERLFRFAEAERRAYDTGGGRFAVMMAAENKFDRAAAEYVRNLLSVPASLAALGTGEGSGGASPGKPNWIDRAAWCAEGILRDCRQLRGIQPIRSETGRGSEHMYWMAQELAARRVESETRACRWLGYLQSGLVIYGHSTLETEKERNLASATEARRAETLGSACEGAARRETPSPLPHPQAPNTLSEVEEAKALLEKEKRAYNGNPSEIVEYLRWRSDLVGDEPETRLDLLSRADAIEAALVTLRASQEQDGEVRHG